MKHRIIACFLLITSLVCKTNAQVNQHLIDSLKDLALKFKNSDIRGGVTRNRDSMMKALNGMLHLVDSAKNTAIKSAVDRAPNKAALQQYLKDYKPGDTSYVPIYFVGRSALTGRGDNNSLTAYCFCKKSPLVLTGSIYTLSLMVNPVSIKAAGYAAQAKGSLAEYTVAQTGLQGRVAYQSKYDTRKTLNGQVLDGRGVDMSVGDEGQLLFNFTFDTLSHTGVVLFSKYQLVHTSLTLEKMVDGYPVKVTDNSDNMATLGVGAATDVGKMDFSQLKQNAAMNDLNNFANGVLDHKGKDDGTPKPVLVITHEAYGFKLKCNYVYSKDGHTQTINITAFIGKATPDYKAVILPKVTPTAPPANNNNNNVSYQNIFKINKRPVIMRTAVGMAENVNENAVDATRQPAAHADKPDYQDIQAYQEWKPEGPKTDGSDNLHGDRKLNFTITATAADDDTKVLHNYTVFWSLDDVTNYPGFCNNFPKYTDNPDVTPDLKFDEDMAATNLFDNVSDKQATTLAGKGEYATAHINCMDYAAWGKLTALVITDLGELIIATPYYNTAKGYITIPYDIDENKLADEWETSVGTYGLGRPLTWDEDNKPEQQRDDGDGYTLFEEYRGFAVLDDATGKEDHKRTDPLYKDVFIYDIDGLYKTYYAPINPSQLHWHTVSKDQIIFYEDKQHKLSDLHRWVNFNKVDDYFYAKQYSLVLLKYDGNNPCRESAEDSEDALGITYHAAEFSTCNGMPSFNLPPNVSLSPVKHHIETVIYFGAIRDYVGGTGSPAEPRLFEIQLGNAVRHELGHYLGIQHHSSTNNAKAATTKWDNAMDGVVDCIMRNGTPEEDNSVDFLSMIVVKYCHTGENGFVNTPVEIHNPDGTLVYQSNGVTPRHNNLATPEVCTDNCWGQITVKSTPGP